MSRVGQFGVYQSDVMRTQENQVLGAVPAARELGADSAPFAAEWLQRLNEMSEVNRFASVSPPSWVDASAPPSRAELQQALMTAFQKAESTDPSLAGVLERYLRLNLEMTHRTT